MSTPKRILVPLADGFEEIEAIAIIDTLRRAGLEVVTAALKGGSSPLVVHGAHGVQVVADAELGKLDGKSFHMLVLPGGMPGTKHLSEDPRVIALVRSMHAAGKHVAAICAAPTVLAQAGILKGLPATCYPGFQDQLGGARSEPDQRVVRAGKVLTSQGPGTAIEFALEIVRELLGAARAAELESAMIVRTPAAPARA